MINIFKYITLTESSLPSIHAEIKEIKDPYHPDTDLAVDLTFYNTNKERIAEASISGYNTDMPLLYNIGRPLPFPQGCPSFSECHSY